jgi:hypothetical protein
MREGAAGRTANFVLPDLLLGTQPHRGAGDAIEYARTGHVDACSFASRVAPRTASIGLAG